MGIVGAEEEYHFEVRGWLRVSSAFTAADAAVLGATIRQRGGAAAALEMLLQQPALQQCLDATMATFNHVNPPTPHPDGQPQLVTCAADWGAAGLGIPSPQWDPARAFRQVNNHRWAQRLAAVVALAPSAVRLISASHLAELPPTADALAPSSHLWETVTLAAGDLLVLSVDLVTSSPEGSLVLQEFIGPTVRPAKQPYMPPLPVPDWAQGLAPAEAALLQQRWSDDTANPVVFSDGEQVWTGDEGRRRAVPSPPPPPPAYAYESQGTEMYEWDTRGYIVLRCANRPSPVPRPNLARTDDDLPVAWLQGRDGRRVDRRGAGRAGAACRGGRGAGLAEPVERGQCPRARGDQPARRARAV